MKNARIHALHKTYICSTPQIGKGDKLYAYAVGSLSTYIAEGGGTQSVVSSDGGDMGLVIVVET